ncbi:hypothetical protein ACN47E_006605 [Coniothyrium glycines]
MATAMVPPRTPSPKVRIRSQSLDSPASRISVTPIEESPFSKSSGFIAIQAMGRHNDLIGSEQGRIHRLGVLLPLHTKISDGSMSSGGSEASMSFASSPTDLDSHMNICADPPSLSTLHSIESRRPHPLAFTQAADNENAEDVGCPSPFLYRDLSAPMHSPWLVRAVLALYDARGLDWMSVAGSIERIWGVRASSAEVLEILSNNGRISNRRWWD